MATYLILNTLILCTALIALRMIGTLQWNKATYWTLALLLLLTAIFDSLIIAANIVAYDSEKILGLTIGSAPIEDFFYTILVVFMIPALWRKLGARRA